MTVVFTRSCRPSRPLLRALGRLQHVPWRLSTECRGMMGRDLQTSHLGQSSNISASATLPSSQYTATKSMRSKQVTKTITVLSLAQDIRLPIPCLAKCKHTSDLHRGHNALMDGTCDELNVCLSILLLGPENVPTERKSQGRVCPFLWIDTENPIQDIQMSPSSLLAFTPRNRALIPVTRP